MTSQQWWAENMAYIKNLADCWWAGGGRIYHKKLKATSGNTAMISIGSVMWEVVGKWHIVQPWPWGGTEQIHAPIDRQKCIENWS